MPDLALAGDPNKPYWRQGCPQLNYFSGAYMIDTISIITSILNDPRSKKYVLQGDPTPWMRAGSQGRHFYDRQKQLKLCRGIELNAQNKDRPKITRAVRLVVMFYMPMAKSWKATKRDEMRGTWHVFTPDSSNLTKFIEDLSVDIALMHDDCLIASTLADKIYDDVPRTEFVLQELR